MRIADSSFLLALFNDQDRFHGDAQRLAQSPETVLVPAETWCETVGVLHRRGRFAESLKIRAWILSRPNYSLVHSGEREHRLAWSVYEEQGGKVSLTDAVGVAWAKLESAALLSFDARQVSAAGQR
ncbi:MAG TPA: PIN domain-containing protein [Candidatus Thermoplasmatota archaeon]|nr:PIN domain-containing protein [Candidatus Thermoplasmatota archaeon]